MNRRELVDQTGLLMEARVALRIIAQGLDQRLRLKFAQGGVQSLAPTKKHDLDRCWQRQGQCIGLPFILFTERNFLSLDLHPLHAGLLQTHRDGGVKNFKDLLVRK